jgi:acetyltransferase-like isoleucine patch superfamily enzyme
VIEEKASIGANSSILPGIRIGHHAVIGTGAVVTRDVEPNSVMVGVPAKKFKK